MANEQDSHEKYQPPEKTPAATPVDPTPAQNVQMANPETVAAPPTVQAETPPATQQENPAEINTLQAQQPQPEEAPEPIPQIPQSPPMAAVQWTAKEYIEHEKTQSWYAMFLGATIGVSAVIFLITRELLATAVIILVGGSVAFFANRPPGSRSYEVSHDGVKVNDRHYDLEEFKSFSVVEEGAHDSIWLKPVRRFAPFLIIYFEQADEEKIVGTLSAFLPHEERELDSLDRLTRKLRF